MFDRTLALNIFTRDSIQIRLISLLLLLRLSAPILPTRRTIRACGAAACGALLGLVVTAVITPSLLLIILYKNLYRKTWRLLQSCPKVHHHHRYVYQLMLLRVVLPAMKKKKIRSHLSLCHAPYVSHLHIPNFIDSDVNDEK